MEVVLVDDGPPVEPLKAQHEVERLADRGLAHRVAAHQQAARVQEDCSRTARRGSC